MKVVPPNEKPALLVRVRLAEPERIGLPHVATSPTGPSLTTIDILQECYAKVKIDEVRLCNPHKGALPTAMLMRPDGAGSAFSSRELWLNTIRNQVTGPTP